MRRSVYELLGDRSYGKTSDTGREECPRPYYTFLMRRIHVSARLATGSIR